ncbi:MAG: hypothetical protein ACLFQZ_11465 [Spirochaetaceae bacterium]
MVLLSVQIVALLPSVVAIPMLFLAYRRGRSLLALRFALFLITLWIVSLSFALHQLEVITGRVEFFFAAAALNGLGSLAFIAAAPPFYHAALTIPLTRPFRYGYAAVDLLLLFVASGLAWERYRGVAVMLLHTLLFVAVLYGVLLVAIRYRALAEPTRRRGARIFVLLSLLLLPLYLESRMVLLGPFVHSHWFDAIALPLYLLSLSVLTIPFLSKRLTA